MPFTNLIIAGSPALLRNPTFTITILTRANTTNPPPFIPGAKVIPINYNDHVSVVKAITGADAIISLLSGTSSKDIDLKLLHAAQEARVRRIFPSEYTLDVLHPNAVSLLSDPKHWPQPASPVVTARAFASLAQNGPTSYTTIVPGAFYRRLPTRGL